MVQLNWLIASLVYFAAAVLGAKPSTLVVYDSKIHDLEHPDTVASSVSQLLESLDQQYEVTTKTYDDEFSLFFEESRKYDNLVLLPSSKKTIGAKDSLAQNTLVQFIDEEGNVLVVGNPAGVLPDSIRVVLNEVGIYPSPKNYRLFDHFHQGKNGGVKLGGENLVKGNNIVSEVEVDDYVGGAALVTNNELLVPIIKSTKTGFSTADNKDSIDQDTTWTFGEQGFAAVGFQALNNARLAWVGSESLLSKSLVDWTFQQKGVLKLHFVEHYRKEEPVKNSPSLYRVKEDAFYTVGVSEYVNGTWVPYDVKEEEAQLQLSFKMLDPYVRINLRPLGLAASKEDSDVRDMRVYFTEFTVPDQHGMFTFELDYKRPGLSFLSDKKVVAVRHLANDEFKRSWDITNSWLYVASAGLVVVTWFLFVVNYIYVGKTNIAKKNI